MQNIFEFSRLFNWVDIVVLIVFLRIIFISLRQGLEVEFFKFLGVFCGLYFSLHYYFSLAVYLNGRSGAKNPPGHVLEFIAYAILLLVNYLIFWLFRILVSRFITAQMNPFLSKWGGCALGLGRALLFSSLILFSLLVTKGAYFRESVRYSLSGAYLARVAPGTYTWIWENAVSKFNSGEKFNDAVQGVILQEPKQKSNNK
jgi:uncharacterized membrane protein required for colicin V production